MLVKSAQVISVIAWMAGLFYMPRLFVYHDESDVVEGKTAELFETMEYRLYRFIMNPAMIAAWVFGLWMAFTPGIIEWGSVWPYTKAAGVVAMTLFHFWLGRRRKNFVAGNNTVSGRHYRMMNEVPTLLMVVIVVSVIIKPF
jgi:putative membrane protein